MAESLTPISLTVSLLHNQTAEYVTLVQMMIKTHTNMDEITEFLKSGDWYISLILLAASVFAAFLLRIIAMFVIRKISKISHYENLYTYSLMFRASGTLFLMLVLFFIVSPFLNFPAGLMGIFRQAWTILLIVDIAWLMIRMVRTIKLLLLQRYDIKATDNLRARKVYTQFRILEQILVVIIILIALAVALMTFDKVREIGVSILASAGLAGIVLGFAAQKSLANVIAGIQIAISQPLRLDDVVVVEGEWGRVEEITLTYVVINIWDERRLVLPITYFVENHFQNWTRSSSRILGTVYLHVDYKFPVEELRKELKRIVQNTELWDGRVNNIQVTGSNEKTMEVRALVSASDSSKAWDLRVLVREKLIEFIRKQYPDFLPQSRLILNEKQKNKKASPEKPEDAPNY